VGSSSEGSGKILHLIHIRLQKRITRYGMMMNIYQSHRGR